MTKTGAIAPETESLLKGGWLPKVLRRHDLAALDGAEGQGGVCARFQRRAAEDVDFPAFLTTDVPGNKASMMVEA